MLSRQCISAINGIIITFMLSLSEVTLICENRQKYAHFESLICEKKFGTWRLWPTHGQEPIHNALRVVNA